MVAETACLQRQRKFDAGSGYRYGFNGKENDKDISEGGQDYGMRIYDSRVGRFLSVDPLTKSYPWYTPYQFAGNKPIRYIDRDGEEEEDHDRYYDKAMPAIEKTFAANILKLPEDQRAKVTKAVAYAKSKRETFSSGFRWLSTRLLTRWMEGSGGYDILSYKTASEALQVRSDLRTVRKNLEEKVKTYAASLKKEGQYDFTASTINDNQGNMAQVLINDVGSSLGSYKILGRADAYIVVDKNGSTTVIMDISYTLADKYQWKEGKGFDYESIVDHDIMLELEKVGAKPFYIRGYFDQTIRFKNGKETSSSAIMDSKDHSKHPEPSNGNKYAIPESENHKEHDK